MELHDYQQDAVDSVRSLIGNGKRKIILVCPTGSGKTVIAAEIIRLSKNLGKKCLFLVHRAELINQSYVKFSSVGAAITVCKAGDKRVIEDWDVMLATVQTLRNRPPPQVDLVIVDECHLSVAPTWEKLLNKFSSPILGLTATPFRLDGKSLANIYETQHIGATMMQLLEQKRLAPLKWLVPQKITKNQGDVYDAWIKYAQGKKTIVFASSVAHCLLLEKKFNGIARVILGKTPKKEREAAISDFINDAIQVLITVNVLNEGVDVPNCECIILSRETSSLAIFLQRLGRGMRLHVGKSECLILDMAGNLVTHGYPEDIDMTVFSTPVRSKSYKTHPNRVIICNDCFLAIKKYPCWNCGCVPTKPVIEEQLSLVSSEIAYPKGTLKYYVELGKKNGYKKGWAWHKWRDGRHG